MRAAEQLFAERGIHAVSNRLISEAAGQGNNAAVNYHFGSKDQLLHALVAHHSTQIDSLRTTMVDALPTSAPLRDWVECAVRSVTTHISSEGSPSWYARFLAQVVADPALHELDSPGAQTTSYERMRRGLEQHVSDLPRHVAQTRATMTRHVIIQTCAETERALADGREPAVPHTWDTMAAEITDAIVGIWSAPSSLAVGPDAPVSPRGSDDLLEKIREARERLDSLTNAVEALERAATASEATHTDH